MPPEGVGQPLDSDFSTKRNFGSGDFCWRILCGGWRYTHPKLTFPCPLLRFTVKDKR